MTQTRPESTVDLLAPGFVVFYVTISVLCILSAVYRKYALHARKKLSPRILKTSKHNEESISEDNESDTKFIHLHAGFRKHPVGVLLHWLWVALLFIVQWPLWQLTFLGRELFEQKYIDLCNNWFNLHVCTQSMINRGDISDEFCVPALGVTSATFLLRNTGLVFLLIWGVFLALSVVYARMRSRIAAFFLFPEELEKCEVVLVEPLEVVVNDSNKVDNEKVALIEAETNRSEISQSKFFSFAGPKEFSVCLNQKQANDKNAMFIQFEGARFIMKIEKCAEKNSNSFEEVDNDVSNDSGVIVPKAKELLSTPLNDNSVETRKSLFGRNTVNVCTESFGELFVSAFFSDLFVFQYYTTLGLQPIAWFPNTILFYIQIIAVAVSLAFAMFREQRLLEKCVSEAESAEVYVLRTKSGIVDKSGDYGESATYVEKVLGPDLVPGDLALVGEGETLHFDGVLLRGQILSFLQSNLSSRFDIFLRKVLLELSRLYSTSNIDHL